MIGPFFWTPEAVELARSRYRAGDPASAIARDLSERGFAVSRNAVLGKLYRLGELGGRVSALMAAQAAAGEGSDLSISAKPPSQRGRPVNPRGKARPEPRSEVVEVVARTAVVPTAPRRAPVDWMRRETAAIEPVGVTLDTLRSGQCRAPLWGHKDRPDGLSAPYCGAAVETGRGGQPREGAVYCAGHARLFYARRAA